MQEPSDGRPERRADQRPERSGEYSTDGRFDPNELFDVIASATSSAQASSAISEFILKGEPETLKQAIAVYVRSARARGQSVENVLGELNVITDKHQGRYQTSGKLLEPSELKKLMLQAVLEGFVGEDGKP